jgi:KDO2-lipid IV(A) lauroyltransferase
MLEVMKTTTISREAFLERCKMVTPETARDWYQKELNVDAISSHLANWEWFALGTVFDLKYECYAVYKPLTNERMNQFIISSRGRFGLNLVPMKSVREFFTRVHPKPYLFGLLADQAPQNYEKAYEVEFLNQKTYYAPGPGLLAVKYNLQPCWGWMRRVGRSRYEWGMDPVSPDLLIPLTESEVAQIARVSKMHEVSLTDSERGYRIVKEYSRLLEVKIKMAPEDWLWSHRRWKNRS